MAINIRERIEGVTHLLEPSKQQLRWGTINRYAHTAGAPVKCAYN